MQNRQHSVSSIMLQVCLALIPGAAALVWWFGAGVITNLLLAITTALLSEALVLKLRNRPAIAALKDGSALLTACLLGLAIPPLAPWWLVVIGSAFAIVFAKQLYGGLGQNPFNPAMVGYVVLLISFPQAMTFWPTPEAIAQLGHTAALQYAFSPSSLMDSISAASPLDTLRTQLALDQSIADIYANHPFFDSLSGLGWIWVNGLFLLGGLWLIYRGLIGWQIPLAMLLSLALISGLFHLIAPLHYTSPQFHLFSGATMLGAFFIATDPVTAATSNRGRLIYGAGIGLLVYIIRSWGGYPDGVAFAVLLMNMAAPTIDYYTQPAVFGGRKS